MRFLQTEARRHNRQALRSVAHWTELAACAGQDWDGNHDAQREVCASCPVQPQCLEAGLSQPCLYSLAHYVNDLPLYGGMDSRELYAESLRRQRGAA